VRQQGPRCDGERGKKGADRSPWKKNWGAVVPEKKKAALAQGGGGKSSASYERGGLDARLMAKNLPK